MKKTQEFHTVRGYQLLKYNKTRLTSAMEDYLEMIYRNVSKEGYIRMNMLSGLLNVRPSSATKMVQKLAHLGFVDYKRYGLVFLTPLGKDMGSFLLERHRIIENFLKTIGISEDILVETELIEHNISIHTLQNIDILNKFMEKNPNFVERFDEFKNNYVD